MHIQQFPINTTGRDFIVGDIHGEFALLELAMENSKFDPEHDRMFSVGDLIDRGPDSKAALEWLGKPWFAAVLGNHELLALESITDEKTRNFWIDEQGGDWWLELESEEQDKFIESFKNLPLVIEIETLEGKIGIVHADIPVETDWQSFVELVNNKDDRTMDCALWSRKRAHGRYLAPVIGIDRVYCGHTPLERPSIIGNVHLIDTGACYDGGCLTVVSTNIALDVDNDKSVIQVRK